MAGTSKDSRWYDGTGNSPCCLSESPLTQPWLLGMPCIRNLRFPVSRLLGLLASRETRESILSAYPYLEEADIDEALRYAACLSEDETIELRR